MERSRSRDRAGWRVGSMGGRGATARMVLVLACASMPLAACSSRQAVVESDPRGGEETRRQLEAAARADLDALQRAQADHLTERGSYSYDIAELGIEASPGVRLSVLEATAGGFSALASAGSIECALFVGSADPPRAYASTAGVVACRS